MPEPITSQPCRYRDGQLGASFGNAPDPLIGLLVFQNIYPCFIVLRAFTMVNNGILPNISDISFACLISMPNLVAILLLRR